MIADQDDKSIRAGLLYFFIAHAGSVLIMIAFFLMWRESGSLDFDSFRQLSLSPAMASVVFLLGFFGFGAKAGMLPLHSWLPQAHPAAPSHASALMSGVMVKIGIFGLSKSVSTCWVQPRAGGVSWYWASARSLLFSALCMRWQSTISNVCWRGTPWKTSGLS
ncbi:Hydrogenase-4 component B [Morganella morganii]|nr:Hydrogenase-4 component B [Morganella morganii]